MDTRLLHCFEEKKTGLFFLWKEGSHRVALPKIQTSLQCLAHALCVCVLTSHDATGILNGSAVHCWLHALKSIVFSFFRLVATISATIMGVWHHHKKRRKNKKIVDPIEPLTQRGLQLAPIKKERKKS